MDYELMDEKRAYWKYKNWKRAQDYLDDAYDRIKDDEATENENN